MNLLIDKHFDTNLPFLNFEYTPVEVYLMALCSPATLRNCLKVGFDITRELGNNGTFYYPKEDLTATGLIIRDLDGLPHANPNEKIEIQKIRNNLSAISLEHGPKGEIEFCYELNLSSLA